MSLEALNPIIHSARIYERVSRSDECRCYDGRIFYLISGELSVFADGEQYRLSPGSVIYIPAGTVYRLKSKYMRCAVIAFAESKESADIQPSTPDDFDEAMLQRGKIEPLDRLLFLSDMEAERDNFTLMCDLFTSGEGEYLAAISARLKLILVKLVEALDERALPPFMVEELDRYIRENCSEEITGTEIGAVFGYHPYYISSMLKERKGLTVKQYVTAYRTKMAKNLLAYTSLSISEVASRVGFADASYFAKAFKTAVGMPPKDYRNKFKDEFI